MDICFNRYIPKSTDDVIIIRPASKTFVNGMAESYSMEDYDPKLLAWNMSQRDYEKMVERLNNSIWGEYPCPGCQFFAYCCCVCTAGLSCIIPFMQVRSAQASMARKIKEINQAYGPYRMKLEHVVEKSTSYVKLYLPNHRMWQVVGEVNGSQKN